MFDIGFTELLVIAVVALIVIGPERLPRVARTVGHLIGRMQRYVNDVKADISREMELDELKKLRSSVEESARSFEQSVRKEVHETETALSDVAASTQPELEPDSTPEGDRKSSSSGAKPAATADSPQRDPALDPPAETSSRKPA